MSLKINEIKKPSKKKDFGRLEDGTHMARIVSVIDYGLQPQTDWQTKEPVDPKKVVAITYENPNETITMGDKDGNKTEIGRASCRERV